MLNDTKESLKFDRTDLQVSDGTKDNGAVRLHRDYIAHCFRWSFVARRCGRLKLNGQKRSILDIGCGKAIPLVDTIFESRLRDGFDHYTGVDLNKIQARREFFKTSKQISILEETNIMDLTKDQLPKPVNTVVCFEMLEHIPPSLTQSVIDKMVELAEPDAEFIISTPVFSESRGMAANHLNEMSRDELTEYFNNAGLAVIENYGTFGSQSDYKKHLTPEHVKILKELSAYHCDAVLANFIAPLYPKYSRNNIWICRKGLI